MIKMINVAKGLLALILPRFIDDARSILKHAE